MRRSLAVAIATLAIALAPAEHRAEEAPDADARDAAAGLPEPESSRRAGAEAKATLSQQHRGLRRSLPIVGIAVGGGFPDLGTLSLLVRPVSSIRLFAGPTWGWVGWGLHGGVVLAPVNWAITPTLSLETGKLFRSNVAFLLDDDGDVAKLKPLLERVDYQYVAADVGIEVGSARGFAFTLRLGLSWVTVKANGSVTFDGDSGARVTLRDPTIRATLPSFKMGFQYWF
jgi:hypothetical protein